MVAKKGRWRGGEWRAAPAVLALWEEANRIAPNRDRSSDGTIGDLAHASRKSNHNPQESGAIDWVDAIDIDHDPARGMDIHAQVRAWVARQDPRLDEVISNGRIWTYARRSEGWRRYLGSNAHTMHAHITVRDDHRHDVSPWFNSAVPFPTPGPPPYRPNRQEDELMETYIRDTESGKVWYFVAGTMRWIGRDTFKNRQQAAKDLGRPIVLVDMHPWALADHAIKYGYLELTPGVPA